MSLRTLLDRGPRASITLLVAMSFAVSASAFLTVEQLRAGENSCVDFICTEGDHQACRELKNLECNVCHTDERCGIQLN